VTSIRIAGSSTFLLALSTKCYIDEGHTMGALALAINHADDGSIPHHICIGDPEYRPIHGPLEPGPIRETPDPPAADAFLARMAVVALAEAELLARANPPSWPRIDERMQAIGMIARTAAYAPIEAPSTLVGTRDLPVERLAERLDGFGRCPSCERSTERYRSHSVIARRDLRLECCTEHGITAVDADIVADINDEPTPRAARWLFTAFTLRQVAEQLESHRTRALDLAHTLEHRAFSGAAMPSARELDCRIASLLGASVAAGGELFLTRQLQHLSASKHGATDRPHNCGGGLLHVDISPIPLRVRRRVWFCSLCGVIGNTLPEYELPEISVEAGRWHATPIRAPFAVGGCALTLAWETRGLRRDDWSASIWVGGPAEGELRHSGHEEFAGLRSLDAIMVADAEVFTMRVPILLSSPDRRMYSLRELNDEDYPEARVPWEGQRASLASCSAASG
jgi:hypothetical protein